MASNEVSNEMMMSINTMLEELKRLKQLAADGRISKTVLHLAQGRELAKYVGDSEPLDAAQEGALFNSALQN